jgi:two-component system OmpR family response regulator/two-component system phosphate regulon response regulator PhoB
MFENTNEMKKILLIDDDEIHLMTAELFLKNEYEILKMKSGNEALEYLNNNTIIPDLILLDILMPNMDGWEVFKRLKAIDKIKNVPIVFLTSVVEENEKKRAYKIGIVDFIIKPFNMTELKSRINEILKKYPSTNVRK